MTPGRGLGVAAGALLAGTALCFDPVLPRFGAAKAGLATLLLVAFLLRFGVGPALARGEGIAIPFRGPLLALLAAMALSLLAATDLFAGARTLLALGGAGLFAGVLRKEGSASRAFLAVAVASGLAVAAYGLLQRAGVDLSAVLRVYESRRYPVSTFGNTNAAAEYVVPCVAVALGGLLHGGLPRALAGATLVVGPLYAGAAGTRAAAVSLAAAALFLGLRDRFLRALGVGAAALLAWGIGFSFRPVGASEAAPAAPSSEGGAVPDSFEVRARIDVSTLRMFAEHAAVGVGAGNFAAAFPPYRDPEEARISSRGFAVESSPETAHCDPLQIAAETGVPGLLALLGLLLAASRACSRTPAIPAAAGAVAIAANSLFRSPLLANPPTLLLFFGLLALVEPDRGKAPSPRASRLGALLLLPVLGLAAFDGARGISSELRLARYFASEERDRAPLEQAVRRNPFDPFLLATLGRDCREHAPVDLARARACLDRALRLRPNEPAWLLNRGIVLAELGLLRDAERDFSRVRVLSPLDPRGPANLAELAARGGRDEEAIRHLREEAALRPGSNPLLRAASGLARKGERSRAERFLRAHLEDFPQDRGRLEVDPLLGPLLPR
ncbi:MAG TPA: tetratricopeptide repeat protein [Planctomycetota bacterium]|jgi:O-antigen ligase|nr:tetratricopeptide repeat protein [Planctomycetota bacterium]